jgi:MoxR-like ATPase
MSGLHDFSRSVFSAESSDTQMGPAPASSSVSRPVQTKGNIFRTLRTMPSSQLALRLRQDLASVGYFIQDVVLHALIESLYSCRPLLLEGPPGAGKTHLAEKLAEVYHLPKAKLSCAEGIQREQVLYTWNRSLQQMYLAQERERGRALEEIQAEIYGLSFLDAGPVLKAFSWSMQGNPGILIIDEIDKLSPGASDMLLEPFSEWSISIEYYSGPPVHLPDPMDRPLVIMTSNDIRHGVSAPLRNRALYAYLTPPTLEERIRILHHNGSSLSMDVFRSAVDILERIQLQLKLIDPPGLRKGTAFIQSLAQKKITALTAEVLEHHLCYLTSNESDYKRLRNFIPSLIEQSHFPPPELKRLVEQHYAVVNNTVAESSPLISQALVACTEITEQLDGLFTTIAQDHSHGLPC